MRGLRSAARIISGGVVALSLMGGTAGAVSITAHITADNHYGLYTGKADGQGLHLVGRNEKGAGGAPGAYNWSEAETWSFGMGPEEYLYLLVWDDGLQQSWIGDFSWKDGALFSNAKDWRYAVGGANPGVSGNLPALQTVRSTIAGATWLVPLASADDGTSPWGNIAAVDDRADFLWADTLGANSRYDGNYLIFRTAQAALATTPTAATTRNGPTAVVPEPATMTLLGTGLLGIAGLVRRRSS